MVNFARMDELENDQPQASLKHIPVMLEEVLSYLSPVVGGTYVDGTLGLGGHAEAILQKIGPSGTLVGMDHDRDALVLAKDRLKDYASQCHFIHSNFNELKKELLLLKIDKVDGILLDLGISSFQLNDPQRGFSIRQNGPLDMRMDQGLSQSAFELVNSLPEQEIAEILKNFGQERFHYRIARGILYSRNQQPIKTTQELALIVLKSMPRGVARQKIHPATRTFQALRIAVNKELESLENVLDQCVDVLKEKGRIVVIAFHSLEDKIIKDKFRVFQKTGVLKNIVKKPLRPTEDECHKNSRSRSARLRAAERI